METIFNRDSKLQIMRAYLEKGISFDKIQSEYAIDKNTVEDWIRKLLEDADHFFEREKLDSEFDSKIKKMSDTIKEKEKIISVLERDNYELKKITYTFKDDDE